MKQLKPFIAIAWGSTPFRQRRASQLEASVAWLSATAVVKRPIEPRNRYRWCFQCSSSGYSTSGIARWRGVGRPAGVSGNAQSRGMGCQETWESLYSPLERESGTGTIGMENSPGLMSGLRFIGSVKTDTKTRQTQVAVVGNQ